ncbi:MAG: glycosyltransferase family 4 protein [Candidatus Eisenbacteria sp.]|nr:glycosyltransferase family 4 protein [Candidatus Eisenbacteria bacterium]
MERRAERSTERRAERNADRRTERSTERSAKRSAEWSVEGSAERNAERNVEARRSDPPLKVLGLYWQTSFWSLGPRKGVSSFFLAPQSFARFGHEIHISAPRGKGQPALEEDEGMLIHRYRGAIRFDSNARHPLPVRLTSRLLRYLYYIIIGTWNGIRLGRQIKPDIVIGYHYHSAAAASLAARILGVPNITRLFGTQLSLIMRSRLRRLAAFIQIIGLRAPASYIIMHDDGSEGDIVAKQLGVPPKKLCFWRDGYEPAMYRPGESTAQLRRSLQIPQDHVVLFCVGRLTVDKRMERLVEVMPAVLREEPAVTLMLVGDGVDRPMIERTIGALRLEGNVRLTGAVSRDELPKYFNVGDIFVGVSDRTNANLPPIEAMSCAKTLVLLNTGGTRHLVDDGRTGILVDPGSWRTELPSVLVALIRDPERRDKLGRAGREKLLREIPTVEERQRMEVDLAIRAVREFRESESLRTVHRNA